LEIAADAAPDGLDPPGATADGIGGAELEGGGRSASSLHPARALRDARSAQAETLFFIGAKHTPPPVGERRKAR
jgi:hypothetical protein